MDFYCAAAKLAIELDGSQHYEEKQMLKDNIRTERIESRNGVHTIEASAELGFGSRAYELIEV